jgi:hypothetical protein
LDALRIPYRIVDSDLELGRLRPYRYLIVPLFDFVDPALLQKLSDYVTGGGRLIVGPRRPYLDHRFTPYSANMPSHIYCTEEELENAIEDVFESRAPPLPSVDLADVELSVHRDQGDLALVFVANRSGRSCTAKVTGAELEGYQVWDALNGVPVHLGCLHLQARQIRMLRCQRRIG